MAEVVFALMPEFVQVFIKVEACLAKVVFALMPESGQVFVKVEGLFGQGGFCLDA